MRTAGPTGAAATCRSFPITSTPIRRAFRSPPAIGAAPQTKATLAALQKRVDALNDEDRIRNLQAAYGFYAGPQDVGRRGRPVRAATASSRSAARASGAARRACAAGSRAWARPDSRTASSTTACSSTSPSTIAPAATRRGRAGIELGMLGEADQEKGWWEVATFRNRFVKEGGVWKIREMRRFPLVKTDIFQGWGKSRIVDPVPAGANKPDAPVPAADAAAPGLAMPALPRHSSGHRQARSCRRASAKIGRGERADRRDRGGQDRVRRARGGHAPARPLGRLGRRHERLGRLWLLSRRLRCRPASAASWRRRVSRMSPFAGYYIGRDRHHQRARQRQAAEDAAGHLLSLAGAAGGADLRRRPLGDGPLPPVPAAHRQDGRQGRRFLWRRRSGAACITTDTCWRTASGASGS